MGSLSTNSNIANSTVIQFNPQAGATYTLQAGDSNKVVTLSNAGGCTVKGNPALLGPGFHCWIEARNNAANLITQFGAEKFFMNGVALAGVTSFNLSPAALQTGIGWDDVVHIATDGTNWHVIQGGPNAAANLTLGVLQFTNHAATYQWNTWNPSDTVGTNTFAPATAAATISATDFVTFANAGGTVTFTAVVAGKFLVNLSSSMLPGGALWTYNKLTFSVAGTGTLLVSNSSTIVQEFFIASSNERTALSAHVMFSCTAGQTMTILPTVALSGTVSGAGNFVAGALATCTYVGN